MIRMATDDGWWLITHPDHAQLAGAFAAAWGNERFAQPEPRTHVLLGIAAHDDGWRERDAAPVVTREGRPAAFSSELVGRYSAFEEIDLAAYLAVRRRAALAMAEQDAYAAILISMHTHSLLSERADRSTIRPEQLPLLDAFLGEQRELQATLRGRLQEAGTVPAQELTAEALGDGFRLLQAVDNLSLLGCVDFSEPGTLLHPLRRCDGGTDEISVERTGERSFRLLPYPLREGRMRFELSARFVTGVGFGSNGELAEKLAAATPEMLEITVHA